MGVALAFGFIPATFTAFIVHERETRAKHLQMLSGVSATGYWLSNFAWDMVIFSAPAAVCGIMLLANGNAAFTGENFPVWFLGLILYGLSCIPFSYLASWLFKENLTAQNVMVLVSLIGGMGLTLVNFFIMAASPSTSKSLRFIFRLCPIYALADILLYLSLRQSQTGSSTPWDLECAGWDLIFMLLESVVYFGSVMFIEWMQTKPELLASIKKCMPGGGGSSSVQTYQPLPHAAVPPPGFAVPVPQVAEDPDVAVERQRVQSGGAAEALIQLHGLRKEFTVSVTPEQPTGIKVAVDNLHFAVEHGECFGFLGQNGAGSACTAAARLATLMLSLSAQCIDLILSIMFDLCVLLSPPSKTTTLSMLTGELNPTSGTAKLYGYDLIREQDKSRPFTGYCPQFDAIDGRLTATEVLVLFAEIRGVRKGDVGRLVQALIDRLGLVEHKDQAVQTYSGGTKRKLSVAVALIGNPPIVFLDEPSTGMDPLARRFMCKSIRRGRAGKL
jgi:ATP-binding cassette subfamily A (ABC1) protein 3